MKYIKTKDGKIISLINNDYDVNAKGDIVLEDNRYIPYDEIEKTADTIEELCEEFVSTRDNEPQIIRFILHMNDGTVRILFTELEVKILQGQYKSIKKEKLTEKGWKEISL